jgi:thiol-disulfide isomerase/thioredoxin
MSQPFALAAVAALALTGAAFAQNDAKTDDATKPQVKPLTIGDPARAIDIEHWIKGDEISEFKDGKIYVVEFWATWCGPCRASMPHITKLQDDYKDYGVTLVGVSDEELDVVTEWLAKTDKKSNKAWNEIIGYTLTTDPDMSVKNDYMVAAGQRGIPTAFIIGKDQHIEWIGHPMDIDKALESVVKDNWNRAEFKTKWEKEQAAEKAYEQFMTLLLKDNNPDEAYKIGAKVVEANWDNAMMLNGIAWTVVDSRSVKKRDLDFAMKAAKRANELTHDKDGAVLDTLARVYYEKGDLKEAVKIQKRAVENVEDENMADELRKALDKYETELAKKGH